jgi:hypothetical protein
LAVHATADEQAAEGWVLISCVQRNWNEPHVCAACRRRIIRAFGAPFIIFIIFNLIIVVSSSQQSLLPPSFRRPQSELQR